MHLLVLTQNDIALAQYGGGLRASALAQGALAQGHRVSVIRFVSPGESFSAADSSGMSICDVQMGKGYSMAPIAAIYHLLNKKAMRFAREYNKVEAVTLVQSDVPWASISGGQIARKLGVPHILLSNNCETTLARQFSLSGPARKLPIIGNIIADFNCSVLRRFEKRAIESADITLTPSYGDITEMQAVGINAKRVWVLPNGTWSKPMPEKRAEIRARLKLADNIPAVIFVGRMDYPPNADAIHFICTVIGPACPEMRFFLVGSNPPQITTPPNVTMIGQVEAVEPYLAAADISIVPLSRGSGTRIKILDAWAAGLPIISTSIGASGLDYVSGQNLLIEDDLMAFPGTIRKLVASPTLQQTLREGALAAAVPYTWAEVRNQYMQTLEVLAGQHEQSKASHKQNRQARIEVAG